MKTGLTCAVDDTFSLDGSLTGHDSLHHGGAKGSLAGEDIHHWGVLDHPTASPAGEPRERRAQAVRVDGPVQGGVESPVDVGDVHQRVESLGLLRAQDETLDPHDLSDGVESLVLLQSLLVVGNEEAAIINPARLDPGLSLEAGEDLVGVAQQLDLRVVGSQPPHQASSVPGGSWAGRSEWGYQPTTDIYRVSPAATGFENQQSK